MVGKVGLTDHMMRSFYKKLFDILHPISTIFDCASVWTIDSVVKTLDF